ncbi:MAG: DUF4331 family protein [Oceanococcaceae bacterium]
MSTTRTFRVSAALSIAAVVSLAACGGGGGGEGFPTTGPTQGPTPAPTATPPPEDKGFTQRDRTALPAVATVFIAPFESARNETDDDPKNAFNLGEPAMVDDFSGPIQTVLVALRANDSNTDNDIGGSDDVTRGFDPANPMGPLSVSIADAVPILAADKMLINLTGDVSIKSTNLLGVELGVPNSFGGRSLEEDIIDAALNVIVFPGDTGCDDGDAATPCLTRDFSDTHTAPFRTAFPYVGEPHPRNP